MGIRKARVDDVRRIKQLIETHMHEGFMLPRPLSELYENIRDFFVYDVDGEVHGAAALHIVWEDLAEIKSLVVDHYGRGKGWGRELVNACLEEAREHNIDRVFALTQAPGFFNKLGFFEVDRAHLPHKVWAECIKCHKFPECDEIAVGINVLGETGGFVPKEELHAASASSSKS